MNRTLLLQVGLAISSLGSVAADASTPIGQMFTGQYQIVSCEPECKSIVAELGGGMQLSFANVKALSIAVLDQTDVQMKTCDGGPVSYEFNIFASGPGANGTFMHNNIASDSGNPWRNICDGRFEAKWAHATLKSPRIEIDLQNVSRDRFILKWRDDRYKFAGTFELRK